MLCWFAQRRGAVEELKVNIQKTEWLDIVAQLVSMLRGSLTTLDVDTYYVGVSPDHFSGLLESVAQLTGLRALKMALPPVGIALQLDGPNLQRCSLHGLTQLESLVWGPDIRGPVGLRQLTRLTLLELGVFPSEQSQDAIKHLRQLHSLGITSDPGMQGNEPSLAFLAGLTGLMDLRLRDVTLVGVPPTLSQLTMLQCEGSNLEGGAAWLRHLPRLKQLQLRLCELASLPAQLTCCTALRDLDLSLAIGLQLSSADVRLVLAGLTGLTWLGLHGVDASRVSPSAWVDLCRACPDLASMITGVGDSDGEDW